MSFAFGLQMIHPSAADSKPHILGHATARTTTGDTLFEVWNGSTSASLRAKLDLDGRWLIGDGTFGKPAFAFKEDTDCGMYRIAANNVGIAVNGAKVLDVATTGISVVGTITASTSITATTTVTATTSVLTDLVKARSNAPLVFQLSDGTAVATFANASGNLTLPFALAVTGLVSVGGSTPASAAATGTAGTITWEASYIYVCVATNTWERVAIATW
jgi:hypothetical protein